MNLKISLIMIIALLVVTIGSAGIFAEELPEEETIDIVNIPASENQMSGDIEADVSSNDEESEEDVLGQWIDNSKDWNHGDSIRHRYFDLSEGDIVEVTPLEQAYWPKDGEFTFVMKDFVTARDSVSNCTYGIMSIPDHDAKDAPTAFVRIPNVGKIEQGKTYEAEFLFDVDKKLGHGNADNYSIQIIGQRIYFFVIHTYNIVSPEAKLNDDGTPFVNPAYIYLLYSTDMNGNDIKLHMREVYSYYDSVLETKPCWTYYEELPSAIQNKDGKWYAMTDGISGTWKEIELPDGMISNSDIGGFLSPSNEWFGLEKRYGKNYLEKKTEYNGDPTVTTYEQMMYVRQWLFDNGYTQHLYIGSFDEAEKEKKEELKEKQEYIAKDEQNYTTTSANRAFIVKDKIDANIYLGKATGKIRYISSDKKIASVKKSGIIKAKKPGSVVITRQVKDGKLWVNQSALKLEICKPETTLPKNTLELKMDPDKVYDISDYITNSAGQKPEYIISNSGMAVIGSDATKMTTLAQGKATIIAKFNNYKLKIKVIVTP